MHSIRSVFFHRYTAMVGSKSRLVEEMNSLWDNLEALESPVVYCHNDINPQNIIYNEERGTVNSRTEEDRVEDF